MSKYHWEGELIKLNEKDYNKMLKSFPFVDLDIELMILDEVIASEKPKNWYVALLYKLRYRNDQIKVSKEKNESKEGCFDRHVDRSWAPKLVASK